MIGSVAKIADRRLIFGPARAPRAPLLFHNRIAGSGPSGGVADSDLYDRQSRIAAALQPAHSIRGLIASRERMGIGSAGEVPSHASSGVKTPKALCANPCPAQTPRK